MPRLPDSRLAESYIHLRRLPLMRQSRDFTLSRPPLAQTREEFADLVERHAYRVGREIYGREPTLELVIEDGSVKVRVAIAATSIFAFVSSYGSFRSGADHLVADARRFTELVISSVGQEAPIRDENIIRIERRLGVPGEIQRLFADLDRLADDRAANPDLAARVSGQLLELLGEIAEREGRDQLLDEVPQPFRAPLERPRQETHPILVLDRRSRNRVVRTRSLSQPPPPRRTRRQPRRLRVRH